MKRIKTIAAMSLALFMGMAGMASEAWAWRGHGSYRSRQVRQYRVRSYPRYYHHHVHSYGCGHVHYAPTYYYSDVYYSPSWGIHFDSDGDIGGYYEW